jgi:hypothetical protein
MHRVRGAMRPRISRNRFAQKNRFWRATMSYEAGERENFSIAKIRDSESAQRVFEPLRRPAITSAPRRSSNA